MLLRFHNILVPQALNKFKFKCSVQISCKKKETLLNKIIKATFNQHPLKMKAIRKAIIDNNKKAFPTGKPTSMQAGATLMIPSFGEIVGMPSQKESGISEMSRKENPYVSTDPHRGWVRFP